MAWNSHLEQDEVLISEAHPMNYVYSIMKIERVFGLVKVHVKKNHSFDTKTHQGKTSVMVWDEVKKLIEQGGDIKIKVIDSSESEDTMSFKIKFEV